MHDHDNFLVLADWYDCTCQDHQNWYRPVPGRSHDQDISTPWQGKPMEVSWYISAFSSRKSAFIKCKQIIEEDLKSN